MSNGGLTIDQFCADVKAGLKPVLVVPYSRITEPGFAPLLSRQLFVSDDVLRTVPNGDLRFACTQMQCADVRPEMFTPGGFYDVSAEFPNRHTEFYVYMYGVLTTGQAVTFRIRNYRPYFYVDIGRHEPEAFHNIIKSMIMNIDHLSDYERDFQVDIQPMFLASEGYQEYPKPIAKIAGRTLAATRKLASTFKYLSPINVKNLSPMFHRTFSRDCGIRSGFWIDVRNAKQYLFNRLAERTKNSVLHYDIDYRDIVTTDIPLKNDMSVVLSWDIETSSNGNSVPLWTNPQDMIEMACYNFFQYSSDKPLLCVGATLRKTHDYARKYETNSSTARPTIIFECDTMYQLTRIHAHCIGRFQPAFVIGFADSQYDWPWVFNVARNIQLMNGDRQMSYLPSWYTSMCYSEQGLVSATQFDRNRPSFSKESITARFENVPQMKIDADTKRNVKYLVTDGYMCIDMQAVLLARFDKAQAVNKRSMNFFSEMILGRKKVDISETSPDERIRREQDSYAEMRRILRAYETSNGAERDGIDLLIFYCFVDGELPHLMMLNQGIIGENRSFCDEAFIRMEDSILRANALKIANTVQYYALNVYRELTGYALLYNTDLKASGDDDDSPKEKIKGALVVKPRLGIETMIPIAGLDINSLYPSIIITYNICHSQMISRQSEHGVMDYAESIRAVNRLGWNNVNEFSYQYEGREHQFWTRKHFGNERRMGVIPYILRKFINVRGVIKELAAKLKDFRLEILECLMSKQFVKITEIAHDWRGRTKYKFDSNRQAIVAYCDQIIAANHNVATIRAVWADIDSEQKLANYRQNAIKVMMNAFYGVMASKFSFLCNIDLSSAVTSQGQKILRLLHAQALKEGYVICYGDTDSMYVRRTYEYYFELIHKYHTELNEIVDAYAVGLIEADDARNRMIAVKRAYYSAVITDSIPDMQNMCVKINKYLESIHDGIGSITIAYEEVMLPSIFLNKKIYFGLIHKDKPILDLRLAPLTMKELEEAVLIKGLAMKKRGYSPMLVELSMHTVKELMDPFSDTSLRGVTPLTLVEQQMRDLMHSDVWKNVDQFSKTVTYKRYKHNPVVQDFVAKLRARGDPDVPDDGDNMKVVVVQIEKPKFDIYGRKNTIRRGDTYEFLDRARTHGIPVDKRYYLEQQFLSPMSMFICYRFDYPDDDYDRWRKTIANAAKKHLKGIIDDEGEDSKITYHDANRYMRDLVKHNQSNKTGRMLSSMFHVLANGQHFRIREDTPSVLIANARIGSLAESIIDQITAMHGVEYGPSREHSEITAELESIAVDVRNAYAAVEQHILTSRMAGVPFDAVVFDAEKVDIIIRYIDMIEEIRSANAKMVIKARNRALGI